MRKDAKLHCTSFYNDQISVVKDEICVYTRLPIELKETFLSIFSAGQYRPVIQSQTS